LTDNPFQSRDWESRARFFAYELTGKCGDYPDFGLIRHFRLRGMQLTLSLSNVVIVSGHLRSLDLAVRAAVDHSAVSAIAQPSPHRPPPRPGRYSEGSTERCSEALDLLQSGRELVRPSKTKGPGDNYPSVVPAQKEAVLPASGGFAFARRPLPLEAKHFEFLIKDSAGLLQYTLQCSAYTQGGKIDRYGISCGLFSIGSDRNLLDMSMDPYTLMSRADILPEQIYGPCSNYPDWGASREFRLRGFRLRMSFTNPISSPGEWSEYSIRSVTLRTEVTTDPEANWPDSRPSRYIYWQIGDNQSCDRPLVASQNPR
jgi:hypothetical protein